MSECLGSWAVKAAQSIGRKPLAPPLFQVPQNSIQGVQCPVGTLGTSEVFTGSLLWSPVPLAQDVHTLRAALERYGSPRNPEIFIPLGLHAETLFSLGDFGRKWHRFYTLNGHVHAGV